MKTILFTYTSIILSLHSVSAQSEKETLNWINSKLKVYMSPPEYMMYSKVYLNQDKCLIIYDVRGNYSSQYYIELSICLEDVQSINYRIEDSYVSIDIIPKDGKIVLLKMTDFSDSPTAYNEIDYYIENNNLFTRPTSTLSKLSIHLTKSALNNEIHERMLKAFKNLFKINKIVISEEKF